MTSAKDRYLELIALTQLYLLQEHTLQERVLSDLETFLYFRNFAIQKQNSTATSSQIKIASSNPPPSEELSKLPAAQQIVPKVSNLQKTPPPLPKAKEITSLNEVKNPISQPEKKEKETRLAVKEEFAFTLESTQQSEGIDFADLRRIISEKIPHITFLDTIPDDQEAKNKARSWDQKIFIPQVVILSFDEALKQNMFLHNLAKSLEVYGIKTKIMKALKIEHENGWDELLQTKDLRLIIANGYGIYSLPNLLKHHKEEAKQAKHYLHQTPLLLLSDLSFYLKEPTLKPSLWRVLKEHLAISLSV